MTATIGPALEERMKSAADHDMFEVAIFMEAEPARETMQADASPDREGRIGSMRAIAERAQRSVVEMLSKPEESAMAADAEPGGPPAANVESFWINNSVTAEVDRATLQKLLDRDDVRLVELVRYSDVKELLDGVAILDRRIEGQDVSMASPGDSAAQPTWSVKRINAPLLWQHGITGADVVVAVVDTGVNYDHPDLKDRMWQSSDYPHHGYDFAAKDDNPVDENGHGTCCAGIVAGTGAAGKQTGVAPGARIMAIRVGGSELQFWRGLEFAISQGAHVISMSMTWKQSGADVTGWRRTCESILAAGLLHANSIGNRGLELPAHPVPINIPPPGSCPPPNLHPLQLIKGGLSSVISCGATDDADQLAGYSGRGPVSWEIAPFADYPYNAGASSALTKPDICAPGPGTESCSHLYPGMGGTKPYVGFGGTSSATPHVAGCLALLASACIRSGNPIVSSRIQEAIENTAVRVAGQTQPKQNDFGAGRIDVKAAYDYGAQKGWWAAQSA